VRSRLVISHCLTAPHSSNHKDSRMLLRNIRESTTYVASSHHLRVSPAHMNKLALSFIYSYKQFYYTSQ
jgi:hypothetical protein